MENIEEQEQLEFLIKSLCDAYEKRIRLLFKFVNKNISLEELLEQGKNL